MDADGVLLSRRQVLRGAGGVALAAAVARVQAGSLFAQAVGRPLRGPLTLADFRPHVGSRFDLQVGPIRTIRVTLVEAVDRPLRAQGRQTLSGEAYSLLFVSDEPVPVDGATYRAFHLVLGTFPLFVTPLGTGRGGQQYEAVVNRTVIR